MSDPLAIEAVNLCKQYVGTDVLRGLNLRVPPGSIYGFLGRNGAGKTTTIKILLGMCRPTSGQARVFGLAADDPRASVAIRQRTAFVSEDKDLYDSMTVGEIIRFTAAFYPRWRADLETRYLQAFDLPAGRSVKQLSKGMRSKLALLLAFARGAELLILDEPTSGLDPAAGEEVLQAIVRHVANEQLTVFFSSHHIAEVDQIADHVAIVNHGRIDVADDLDALRERYCHIRWLFADAAPPVTFRSPGVVRSERQGRLLSVLSSSGSEDLIAEARALSPLSTEVFPATLKDVFLATVRSEEQ